MIPEVHLTGKGSRSQTTSRAFPLDEEQQPSLCDSLRAVEWLDVENSVRYKRSGSSTYCNIYAYDYAYLTGAYLPRVFWTNKAIEEENFVAKYGETVQELSANMLYSWFAEYSNLFGWSEVKNLTTAQTLANKGRCVIMVAANKNPARSGHIVAVVPETSKIKAVSEGAEVTAPVQSQAGAKNYKRHTLKWWGSMKPLKIYTSNHMIVKPK